MSSTYTAFPPPQGWHDHCEVCHNQHRSVRDQEKPHLRYQDSFSDQGAEEYLKRLCNAMDFNRAYIKSKLLSHGDLIIKRWSKKSKDKRAALLHATEPGMFDSWPVSIHDSSKLETYEREPIDVWCEQHIRPWIGMQTKCNWAYGMWLNTKDFAEDRMKLLSLLYLRSAYPPSSWAVFDIKEAMNNWSGGYVQPYFNANRVRMYGDAEYGTLTTGNDSLTHSWAIVGFPRALMTIEAQSQVLNTLRHVVDEVIKGATPSGCDKWTSLVDGGFRASGSEALWGAYTNQAFAPPQLFDPKIMLEKAQNRLALLEDDLWLMQTDAAHMHQVVQGMKSARKFDGVRAEIKWQYVGIDLMADFTNRLINWRLIVDELRYVNAIFEKQAREPRAGTQLAEDVNLAMLSLGSLLLARLRMQSVVFNKLLPSLKALRERFTISGYGNGVCRNECLSMDPDKGVDRVRWILDKLQCSIKADYLCGSSEIFGILEREMLAGSPGCLVDKKMYDQLSDLATIDELLTMWRWSKLPIVNVDESTLDAYWESRSCQRGNTPPIAIDRTCYERIGRHLRLFAEHPWPKGRKDLAWLTKATESRQKLATFWSVMNDEVQRMEEASEWKEKQVNELGKIVEYKDDPAYLVELEDERRACEEEEATATAAAASRLHAKQTEQQTVWGSDGQLAIPIRRKQTKAKALRATADGSTVAEPALPNIPPGPVVTDEPNAEPEVTSVWVKQESLTIYHAMFSPMASRSTLRWPQFVQAMADAGWLATESSGSAVTFSRRDGEAASIVFHRPHPEPIVDPIMLQNMGKRMHKRFSWSREMFQLREKEVKG